MKNFTNCRCCGRFSKRLLWNAVAFLLIESVTACKKLIEIPPPVDTMTTEQVFATSNEAVSAAAAIYSDLIQGNNSFANYPVTVFCGLSADELAVPATKQEDWLQFYRNNLFPGNTYTVNIFWTDLYKHIYRANAILEGLKNSTAIPDSTKRELEGEALFVRAFCNFYLVNLFGPVPLVTTVNWRKTNLLARAPVEEVYRLILSDLKEAKVLLAADFSVGKSERIIPNRIAASALLARTYLYIGDWANAEAEASSVIENPSVALETVSNAFKFDSKEAIWQLKQNNTRSPSYNVTPEGYFVRPKSLNSNLLPGVWATTVFLDKVQTGDLRRSAWLDSTKYSLGNKVYFFPGKYKQGAGQVAAGGAYTQYYIVLRLAEQYLIRTEARLKQDKLAEAIADINIIRRRSGLEALNSSLSAEEVMSALIKERQTELFAEWGHRWLDLKRWGIATKVLETVKGTDWQPMDQLYPIPDIEIARNPNLTQSDGY